MFEKLSREAQMFYENIVSSNWSEEFRMQTQRLENTNQGLIFADNLVGERGTEKRQEILNNMVEMDISLLKKGKDLSEDTPFWLREELKELNEKGKEI